MSALILLPALSIFRSAAGLLLITASFLKTRNWSSFQTTIFHLSGSARRFYRELSLSALSVETLLGVLMLVGLLTRVVDLAFLFLTLIFDAVVAVLYFGKLEISCSCFGGQYQLVNRWTLLRNLLLTLLAILLVCYPSDPLRTIWSPPSPTNISAAVMVFVVALYATRVFHKSATGSKS